MDDSRVDTSAHSEGFLVILEISNASENLRLRPEMWAPHVHLTRRNYLSKWYTNVRRGGFAAFPSLLEPLCELEAQPQTIDGRELRGWELRRCNLNRAGHIGHSPGEGVLRGEAVGQPLEEPKRARQGEA